VSSELMPVRLRERVKSIYPEGDWRRALGKPDMIMIIMMYGIPLKTVNKDNSVCEARVLEGASLSKSLQVPSGYRKIER
jgi:hypothetical protein